MDPGEDLNRAGGVVTGHGPRHRDENPTIDPEGLL
jgi:hypothetical protein